MLEKERERNTENPTKKNPQIDFPKSSPYKQILLDGFLIIFSSAFCIPIKKLVVGSLLISPFRGVLFVSPNFPPNQLHRLSANKSWWWLGCQSFKVFFWHADASFPLSRASQKAVNWIRGIYYLSITSKIGVKLGFSRCLHLMRVRVPLLCQPLCAAVVLMLFMIVGFLCQLEVFQRLCL